VLRRWEVSDGTFSRGRWVHKTDTEAGTFQFPFAETGWKEVAAWELAVLLEGIDLSQGNYCEADLVGAEAPNN